MCFKKFLSNFSYMMTHCQDSGPFHVDGVQAYPYTQCRLTSAHAQLSDAMINSNENNEKFICAF